MASSPKPVFDPTSDVLNRYIFNQEMDGQEAAGFGPAEDALSGSGSSSSSSTPSTDPTTLANDWYKAFFSNYGVPSDVQSQLVSILQKYASDPATAQALSTQYLRGTDWYQTKFPGFNAGVQNGIFSDESGYRNYLNSINNIYNQYLGRHVSGDEINSLLAEGVSPDTIARRFAGQAYVNANRNDIQYLAGNFGPGQLSQDQLTALGNENAGIDTQLGQIQQKVQQKAQQIRDRLFQGSLATASSTLGANGLSAPGLGGTVNRGQPDVAA